jgi:hypothetical protein
MKTDTNLLKVRLRSRDTVREFTPEEFNAINPWLLDGDQLEFERF